MHTTNSTPHTTSAWGRTKGGKPALPIAGVVGSILALVTALLAGFFWGESNGMNWTVVIVFLVVMAVPFSAVVWVLIVDRTSIRGAIRNPENSIESQWGATAAEASFATTIAGSGVGAGIATILDADVVAITLMGVFAVSTLAYVVGYLIAKGR